MGIRWISTEHVGDYRNKQSAGTSCEEVDPSQRHARKQTYIYLERLRPVMAASDSWSVYTPSKPIQRDSPIEWIIRVGRRLGHEYRGTRGFVLKLDMAECLHRMTVRNSYTGIVNLVFVEMSHDGTNLEDNV